MQIGHTLVFLRQSETVMDISVKIQVQLILTIGGKKVGIHPARVKKLMVSTNISGKKLSESDYKFHYSFEETFKDWFEDCNREGLF